MAPSLNKWDYLGGTEGSPEAARRGEQRVYAGDLVIDDVLGQGKFVRFKVKMEVDVDSQKRSS